MIRHESVTDPSVALALVYTQTQQLSVNLATNMAGAVAHTPATLAQGLAPMDVGAVKGKFGKKGKEKGKDKNNW